MGPALVVVEHGDMHEPKYRRATGKMRRMLRLLSIVAAIGLADSLNPSTVAPALFLATGEHGRKRVLQFTLGVFAVYFLGGALIALGPGQLALALVPEPDAHTRATLEVVAGGLLVAAGALLWRLRARLRRRRLPLVEASQRSSFVLGASITAIELPTAFPYFGAIAAIVGSGYGPVHQILLLGVFNVCFVLPLLAILAVLWFAGDAAQARLEALRAHLGHQWPVIAAGLAIVLGGLIIYLGVIGLAGPDTPGRHHLITAVAQASAVHHPRVST
jgi:cytochrome c biogenesis protein CcdA